MTRFDDKPLWLVQKVWWAFDESHATEFGGWLCADLAFGEPVVAFTTPEAAQAEAGRLEREERAKRNPFGHGRSIEERTSMPEPVFCDWLEDAGIEPPGIDEDDDWAKWWKASSPAWTQHQRDKVWEALDLVRFFTVVELPPAS
jgi:hypothetical protein